MSVGCQAWGLPLACCANVSRCSPESRQPCGRPAAGLDAGCAPAGWAAAGGGAGNGAGRSGGGWFGLAVAVPPGGVLVVAGAGFEAAVQDADQPVAGLAQRGGVRLAAGAELVVVGAGAG